MYYRVVEVGYSTLSHVVIEARWTLSMYNDAAQDVRCNFLVEIHMVVPWIEVPQHVVIVYRWRKAEEK